MKIYKDFAQVLIKRASDLYKDDYFRIGLKEKVYAFDSSTMKLCLNLYPWAKFHHNKGTFKMHTLINLRRNRYHHDVMCTTTKAYVS